MDTKCNELIDNIAIRVVLNTVALALWIAAAVGLLELAVKVADGKRLIWAKCQVRVPTYAGFAWVGSEEQLRGEVAPDYSRLIAATTYDHKEVSMKTTALFACLLALSLVGSAQDRLTNNLTDGLQLQSRSLNDSNDPAMGGPLWAQGSAEDNAVLQLRLSVVDMFWHTGLIMPNANVTAIYWGASWNNYTGVKISELASFYDGFGNSNYAATSNEYAGGNGQVTSDVVYQGSFVDPTAFPGTATPAVIGAEVCKMIQHPDPTGNGYYPVYVDRKRAGSVGNADFCGWHSSGTCKNGKFQYGGDGTRVQFAFFWDLDNDANCDPDDKLGLHSQGVAALANISAHELSEARTDPTWLPNNNPPFLGWYDSTGITGENGDKCAWSFGADFVTFSNGTKWKLQGEWSNKAFDTGKGGYANRQGYKGCLSGK